MDPCLVISQLTNKVLSYNFLFFSLLFQATDITRQQEFIGTFKDFINNKTLNMRKADHRHFILQIALKCADISNPCR